jgi:antitoxin HicB
MSRKTKHNLDSYRLTVRQLSKDEGRGYLVEYPDIPGCMSDGETIEAAIANGREALRDCIEVFRETGRPIQNRLRLRRRNGGNDYPRTLYAKLTAHAGAEGVSINSMVTAIIAEAVGARQK